MKSRKPEQLRLPFHPTLHQLMHSALAVDSIAFADSLKPVLPPRRIYLCTTGKSVEQIVREFATLLEKAGMLKRPDHP
ncbi:MAG TPA: hypothetical protein VKT99_04375 [Xanthobacteraceae bacterium]|nr:hypothetical protein [Xanthobacteraceae bacterium]